MSTGFVLNIPQEMINRLELADQKIEKLAKTSEDAQSRIVSAFKSIGTHGLDEFIGKLNEVQSKLSQLGSTQINFGANAGVFTGLTSQAQDVIDEVNRIVAAMGKVKRVSGETGMVKNPFAGMTESLKDWNSLQSKIDEADQKIKKLTSTTMDYERQMERIRSGQQIPVAISYNEYVYAKEKIAALQEEKKIYREKQEEITKQNNALADQVRLQEGLKKFVSNQGSLDERRKREDYENLKKQLSEEEKAAEKLEAKKTKLREKRVREEEKAAERERKAYERAYKQLPSTITTKQAGQLVARSMDAKSINQRLVAIKNLQTAVNNLDSTDKRYDQTVRKLNAEIQRQKTELAKLGVQAGNVEKSHRSLMDISGQLARKLALVFSVSQITGYVKKLIEVRGEFELQQRSLQAILQNKDAADKIWQQTVDLAVRSPFRVKDLVSYTKQLAAYRIESEKLFETNKMLADISAGLGVDMQRLILAFGQVRSAAYLRGTELRQFTEAGIPILEQLAQYFTELEGRAVSVGDVFERVSKRMVSFADVEEIFKRMTSEGGTFYRMQEIQAETLQGQISNLKDSVDIMLNDIGKANEDVLKSSVSIVRTVVQNWRILSVVIQQASVALVGFTSVKIIRALRLSGDALVTATIKAKGLTAAMAKLKLSMLDFSKVVKLNPYLFAAAAAAAAIHALAQYGKAVDAMNEKYDDMSQRELRRVDNLKELNKQVEKNNKKIKDSADAQKSAEEGTEEYANAEDALSRARGKNITLLDRLKKEYPEVYASIVVQKDGTIDLTKAIEEQNKVAMRQISLQQQAKGGWFQQDFSTNYEDSVEALGQYGGALEDVKMEAWRTHQQLVEALNLGDITQDSYDSMIGLIDQLKSADDISTVRDILKQLSTTISSSDDLSFKFISNIQNATQRLSDSFVDYSVSLKNFLANIKNMSSTIGNTVREQIALDPEEGEENAKEYIDKVLTEFGVLNQTVRDWARKQIVKIIGVKLEWGQETGGGKSDELTEEWAKRVEKAITKVNNEIKSKSKGLSDIDLFPVPQAGQTKEQYLALAKEVIGIAEMTYNETQQIEDEATVNRTKALAPYADTVRMILNLFKEGSGGGKDALAEKLRNQINLIKEMNTEYEKLTKTFSAEDSASRVLNAYAQTARQLGLDISKMDFTDTGTIASLERLLGSPQYAAQKYALEIQKALDNYQVELDVELKQKADQTLLDDVQELFDRYDLSLELKKLNIPPDLAKSLFDVDYLDLNGLKKAVQEQEAKFIGTDMEKDYKDLLDKIDDMENKAAKERMKTYVKYLMEGMSERVKLKIEELRKLKEIEESSEFSPEQKERIKEGVSKEARVEQQKQEWKDFQGSDMYTMMFEDLEHYGSAAIDMLYTKLSELKTSLSDLPASEVKEIIGQIEKLENIQIERNPFEYLKKYKEEVKNIGFTEGELQTQLLDSQKAEEEAQKYIDIYNTVMQSLMSEDEGVFEEIDAETLSQWNQMLRLAEEQGKTVEEILADRKATVKTEQDNQGKIVKNLNSYKKLSKAQKESLELTQEWLTQVGNLFSSSKDLMESLGVESDSVAMTIADTGSSMVSLIGSAIQFTLQLDLMGVAANSALGVIGWIAIALQAVATVLSAIFSAKDKALQKEIDGHLARAEKLHEKYEELSDAIDSAYDASVVRQFNKEIEKTIQLEIKAIEAAIAAEKSQKASKIDWGWVDEQEKKVKELYNTLNEEHDNYIERWGGFGSDEARFDFIESMTQAWLDSFKETGDGLAGLEEKWDEYFDNLAMKQMALRVSKATIDKYLDMWDKYVSAESAGGEDLTEAEAQDLRLKKEQLLKDLSEKYTSLAESLGITPTTEAGGLSALQKGISSLSESTGQVLEALLNSMRFYVADSNAKLTQLLNNMMGGETESPMLAELRAQTKWMRDIYNLINGMTAVHPNGGRGIKAVM
jgi:DNA repair exonuclease SbcCD ATPase subunit